VSRNIGSRPLDVAPFVAFTLEKRGKQTNYGATSSASTARRPRDAPERTANLAAPERPLKNGDKALVGNTGYRRFLKTGGAV
jgi:hypothetical protein